MASYSEKSTLQTELAEVNRRLRILETAPSTDPTSGEDPPPPPPLSSISYTHTQLSMSNVWIIAHNLGYVPSVSVYDTLDREVYADIDVIDENHIQVLFSQPFSGTAYLS